MKLSDFKVNKGMEDLVKNKEVRFCDIHNKVLEFYCTDDREEICAHCGIKGDHQNCQKIITIKELQNVNSYLIKEIKEKINKIVFVEEFKKNPKLKSFLNQKITSIIKQSRERIMAQYNEIKFAIKKCILNQFAEYEKKIMTKLKLCFTDKEDSFKKLTKQIQNFQKELVFLQRMNKKNNDNYSQIYTKLLDIRRDFRETQQNNQDLTDQLEKFKSTDIKLDWKQNDKNFNMNVKAIIEFDTNDYDMHKAPSHSDDVEAIQLQKINTMSHKRQNSSFLKNNMSKIDQDVSPIPQDSNKKSSFRYTTLTKIPFKEEESNYQQNSNLHTSMDPTQLQQLGRKNTNLTRNSSIRSNAQSTRTNIQSTRKLTLNRQKFSKQQRQSSQQSKYNKLRRLESTKNINNKSNLRLKTSNRMIEYKNEVINFENFMQKMIEALKDSRIGRINFRNNEFVDDIFPILNKVFTKSFKQKLVIDLRKNNLALTPQNQIIIDNLKTKNIIVSL